MAAKKVSKAKADRSSELETLRTEYRSLIGRAIIGGLIFPRPGTIGDFFAGTDYDQDSTGDYNQSGGGNHNQTGGNYTQAP